MAREFLHSLNGSSVGSSKPLPPFMVEVDFWIKNLGLGLKDFIFAIFCVLSYVFVLPISKILF